MAYWPGKGNLSSLIYGDIFVPRGDGCQGLSVAAIGRLSRGLGVPASRVRLRWITRGESL